MSVFGNRDLFAGFDLSEEDQNEFSDDSYQELNHIKEENLQLKTENEELRKALRVITQPSNIKIRDASLDGPVAHVLLFNNPRARQERGRIEEFFFNVSQGRCDGEYPFATQPSAIRCPRRKSTSANSKSSKAFTITDSVQFYSGPFCLDQLGEPLFNDNRLCCYVPDYERALLDALDGEPQLEDKEPKKQKRICFNCGEANHQLKDCPIPKNFKVINQRKQQFLGSMSNPPQSGSNRYHADNEDADTDPRFARFRPGVISETLRRALGMKECDLPPYIYQMRLMGYPPGHLEEARIATSGLSFYSGRNKKAEDNDPELEDGPVDVDKIIAYPGFNVKADGCVIDHCVELGAMPMDQSHSKEIMVSYHTHRNALLKRKAEELKCDKDNRKRRKKDHQNKKDDTTEVDMETSDDGGPEAKEVSTKDKEPIEGATDLSGIEEGEVEDTETGVSCGDEELVGEVDEGDLDEDELQIKREMILHKLRLQDEAVQFHSESHANELLPGDTTITKSENNICDDVIGIESRKVVEEICLEKEIEHDSVHEKSQYLTVAHGSSSSNEHNVIQTNKETHQVNSEDETKVSSKVSTFVRASPESPEELTSIRESPESPGELTSIRETPESPAESTSIRKTQFPEEPTSIRESPESPGELTSIRESPESPGELTSIRKTLESPGESTSIRDTLESSGESTSVCETPESSGKSTSFRDSPQLPGESTSFCETPESPVESISVHESPESPGKSISVCETPESSGQLTCIRESPESHGKSTSMHESPESPGESTSMHESPESPEESTSMRENPNSLDISVVHRRREMDVLSFDQNYFCEESNVANPVKEISPTHKIRESPPTEEDTTSAVHLFSSVEHSTEAVSSVSEDPRVPHRSKFAEGITQFGLYQEETKSRGVYTKLRTLLKNSPRRSGNNP